MKKYKVVWGKHMSDVETEMLKIANTEDIECSFNGVRLVATKNTKPGDLSKYYDKICAKARAKRRNSLKARIEKRKCAKIEKLSQTIFDVLIHKSPSEMTVINREEYLAGKAKNTDDYGAAIYGFAEIWARLMEDAIANGESVADCAGRLSYIADTEGITGLMYGAAVCILSHCWVYGEELRVWHNLATQINGEGEKANASGGVLNPAMLTIGA